MSRFPRRSRWLVALAAALAALFVLERAAGLLLPLAAFSETPSPGPEPSEHVVLLHGLGRTHRSMEPLAQYLRREGFAVHNVDYPSTERTPAELVALLGREVGRCCLEGPERLHFVGHSLGGILIRAYLADHPPPNLGRVVLLAPPNKGSEVIDSFQDLALLELALGPAGASLGTDPESFPNRIGPPTYEVGIIAATRSINPLGSALLPGDDDGAVTLEGTRLDGATDYLLVDATHTFVMQDAEVAGQVVSFLRNGRFEKSSP